MRSVGNVWEKEEGRRKRKKIRRKLEGRSIG